MIRWRLYRATSSLVSSAAGSTNGGSAEAAPDVLEAAGIVFSSSELDKLLSITTQTLPEGFPFHIVDIWEALVVRILVVGSRAERDVDNLLWHQRHVQLEKKPPERDP